MNSPEVDPTELSIDVIDKGVARVAGKKQPDPEDNLEDTRTAQLNNDLIQAKIDDRKADREMRKTYAGRILRYLEIYSVLVALFVIASGFANTTGFILPVEILASLVGSTALAAIGLVGFIARGLFRAPPEN